MKHALALVAVSTAVLLSGCSLLWSEIPAAPALLDANGAPIERVPFRIGVSSATVEKMAKAQGCRGGQGAGLMTAEGPVEVYRMRCEDGAMRGRVFTAKCELRQCVRM